MRKTKDDVDERSRDERRRQPERSPLPHADGGCGAEPTWRGRAPYHIFPCSSTCLAENSELDVRRLGGMVSPEQRCSRP